MCWELLNVETVSLQYLKIRIYFFHSKYPTMSGYSAVHTRKRNWEQWDCVATWVINLYAIPITKSVNVFEVPEKDHKIKRISNKAYCTCDRAPNLPRRSRQSKNTNICASIYILNSLLIYYFWLSVSILSNRWKEYTDDTHDTQL